MNSDEALQREITTAALTALDGWSFALAGSGAIREHGMVDRVTYDVDLFTNNRDPAEFETAVDRLTTVLQDAGNTVDEVRRAPQFAQLRITTRDGRNVDVDLAVDWREYAPEALAVGPVLSAEDAVGSKVSALYTRAEARDFIDVDSIRRSERFSDADLIRAAIERDAGFEINMFADQLERISKVAPRRFEEYGVNPAELEAIRERFSAWASELRGGTQ